MVTRIVCFIKPENICRNTVNQAAKDQEKDEFSHKGHKERTASAVPVIRKI